MTGVVDLSARRAPPQTPTLEGQARCLGCKHEWVAVAPLGTIALQCPTCSLSKGRFVLLVHRHNRAHWVCACGNDLFSVTPDGYYCPVCGDWAKGF